MASNYEGYIHLLLYGTGITLLVTVLGSVVTVFVAILAGLGKLSGNGVVRYFFTIYVELFRGTSIVVQLFFFYYVLPIVGISLDSITASVLVLGLNVGAYGAEVVRAAIKSVPRDQIEACIALNYSPFQRMRRVIIPQATVTMIPPITNLLIDLMKASSLCSIITVADLTFQAQIFRNQTGLTLVPFGAAILIYLAIATVIVNLATFAERRFSVGLDMTTRN